jgi:aryl-alcohol dehydrogenase-like predicted oxidoreductase
MGTMTFGGRGNFASAGATDLDGARRQIEMAVDAGVNLIDTADIYSGGAAEEIVGQALRGVRDKVPVGTKARCPMGSDANDAGLSRHHLIRACEAPCAASRPTTSTCTRSTNGTGKPRAVAVANALRGRARGAGS